MNEELTKSLIQLIDESLAEIVELKKSDRFAASEVSVGESKSGIESREKNGSLDKKDEDKDEDHDDEDKDEEDKDEAEDKKKMMDKKKMDKGEGKNREADPDGGHHVAKGDQPIMGGASDGDSHGAGPGTNRKADPDGGHHVAKMEERVAKMEKMMEKMESHMSKMESSVEKKDLLKSVDDRFSGIESKFDSISKLIKEIADAPVPSKSVSYRGVAPLVKSTEGAESLTKSDIANKLFELKKSGTVVPSQDITSVELGSPNELAKIVAKYNLK